jgi:hypothetical protein
MTIVETLLETPLIAILLLSVLSVEALVLLVLWNKKFVGLPPLQIMTFLGAGAAFALALGCALGNAHPYWLAGCLVVAFILHLTDLLTRWQM